MAVTISEIRNMFREMFAEYKKDIELLNSLKKRSIEKEKVSKNVANKNIELTDLKNKLREIEDRSRRNNLRINGLKENENETWTESKTKGESIFINEDFCYETNVIRKELREKMKTERQLGKFAYNTYDKLIVRDWVSKKPFQLYYAKLLDKASGNTKKTWNVIKEVIRKNNYTRNTLPKKITVDEKNIYDKSIIAEKINSFFINAGPNLASKIPLNSTSFESYLKNYDKVMDEPNLKLIELRSAFYNLKNNKNAGFDKINVNVVKSVYHIIEPLLFHIFNLSLKTGIVPEKLKIARITLIFKTGDDSIISNYRPISILPCFSKLLERIMYNRLFNYLSENNMLYSKQFGFKKKCSTEHAVIDKVNQITNAFSTNYFTLGVFIDLSKAFDTVKSFTINIKRTRRRPYGHDVKNRCKHVTYLRVKYCT
ncbi:uncharacterized protein LOC136084142 [Hydra vulgaris]|uniref:Uncharacterized protein LOC136084142 n=1 Tax=Hydra vulgaris TaxID=6087 RepID=A0ABM4CF89_HYDVU